MGIRVHPDTLRNWQAKGLIAGESAPPTAERISEKEFMECVIDYATAHGFLCYHTRDSRKSVAGFPDLVMVRAGRVIFAELKTETGTFTADQLTWLDCLRECQGIEVRTWRPSQWAEIVETIG